MAMVHSTVLAESGSVVVDKRRPSRKKSLLGGLIVSQDYLLTVECVIRDLSEVGARVRVPNKQVIPARSYLLIPGKEVVHQAEVAWVGRHEYGLKFLETYPLKLMGHPDLSQLRALLVERLPRGEPSGIPCTTSPMP
jgi:hypothetical protein